MTPFDPALWPRLSPLLDEWLDLPPPERAARLQALRDSDPALAEQMALLLEQTADQALDRLLEQPALPHGGHHEGQRIGAYTLERELGHGGMGSVWLAHRTDGHYDGSVAIKFLHAGLLGDEARQRFAREGRLLARLAHPNIARLLDAGLGDSGQPYLVLEYIDGQPIDRYCRRRQLDLPARLRLFLDVLAAVSHAHSRLILHRDLKPGNILVSADGELKLLDFGIAKLLRDPLDTAETLDLTRHQGSAFTPHYAAPEQIEGGDVSTATDVYALGVLLFQLLTDRHPLLPPDGSALDALRAVHTEAPRMSQLLRTQRQTGDAGVAAPQIRALRGDLDTIVAKALKKTPAERYPSAAELADDLRRWLAHEPISARPDSLAYRSARFVRRHWLALGLSAAVLLSLSGTLGLVAWKSVELRHQHEQAEGLVEFMLGDLHQRLQAVGRLDVLDVVGQRALQYYAAQRPDEMDANALGRRARALHLIGEIADQRGQLDQAERLFRQAAASTAALLARSPHDAQRLFDHAQSQYWIGYAAWRRGQAAEAETAFTAYRQLADQLLAQAPNKSEWQAEKAWALNNLGVVWLDQGRLGEARQAFEAEAAIWRTQFPSRPQVAYDLAMALGWLADVQVASDEPQLAEQTLREKLAVLEGGPNAASDRHAAAQRAVTWNDIARTQMQRNDPQAALDSARRSVAAWDPIEAQDPSNLEWQGEAGMAHLTLVEALASPPHADLAAARAELHALTGRMHRLASSGAQRWRLLLPARWLDARLRWADQPDLLPEVLRFLHGLPPALKQPDEIRDVVELELHTGERLAREGRGGDARALWQRAAQRLQALPQTARAEGHTRALADELQSLLDAAQVRPAPHR